jgi:futalosine hydrolase
VSVLVVTAVGQERDAVGRDLGPTTAIRLGPYPAMRATTGAGPVDLLVGGVGPASAAAATATALAVESYDVVFSAGIAGGFTGRSAIGDIVIADTITAADLGCRTDAGFLPLRDLGLDFEHRVALPDSTRWRERLHRAGIKVVPGEVLTLSSMTGTDERGSELARLFPYAVAEAMEGWGVVAAAHRRHDVAIGEIRAVSNVIGRRDPETWDVRRAFDALSHAFAVLLAEPLS